VLPRTFTPSSRRQKVVEAVGNTAPASPDGDLDLTERARRSLQRAVRLANRQRQDHVEAEHILLSVIQVEGRAGQVLRGLGVDPARVRAAVAEVDMVGDGTAGGDGSAHALRASGPAAPAAAAPDNGGTVAPAGPGQSASSGSPGARPARTGRGSRTSRAAATTGPAGTASAGRAEPVPAPVCPACGVALDGSLAHKGLVSRGEAGDLRAFAVVYCAACGSAIGVANA